MILQKKKSPSIEELKQTKKKHQKNTLALVYYHEALRMN